MLWGYCWGCCGGGGGGDDVDLGHGYCYAIFAGDDLLVEVVMMAFYIGPGCCGHTSGTVRLLLVLVWWW